MVCILLGYFGIEPFVGFYIMVTGWFSKIDFGSVISNPATILTVVGGATAVAVPLISKLNSAKQQTQQIASDAKTQVSNINNTLSETTSKLDTANLNLENAQATITKLNSTSASATTQVASLQQENAKLLTQLDALNNIQARATVLADGKEVVRTVIK